MFMAGRRRRRRRRRRFFFWEEIIDVMEILLKSSFAPLFSLW